MLRIVSRGHKRRLALLSTAAIVALSSMAGIAYAATEHYLNGYTMVPHTATISNYHYITNDYVHNNGGGTRLLGCGSPEWGPYKYVNNECIANFTGSRWARGYAENASNYHVNMNAHVNY